MTKSATAQLNATTSLMAAAIILAGCATAPLTPAQDVPETPRSNRVTNTQAAEITAPGNTLRFQGIAHRGEPNLTSQGHTLRFAGRLDRSSTDLTPVTRWGTTFRFARGTKPQTKQDVGEAMAVGPDNPATHGNEVAGSPGTDPAMVLQ